MSTYYDKIDRKWNFGARKSKKSGHYAPRMCFVGII